MKCLQANVIVIGLRGAGKTTIGRALARRLGWSFCDTDQLIEELAGKSIRRIFAEDGEPAFRRLERAVIAEVAHRRGQIVAVGGGAVLSPANRAALRRAGICIWLTAPATVLWRRMGRDRHTARTRPPLTGRGGLAEVRHLLRQRRPLYAALAQHVVHTGRQSSPQVVRAVLAILAEHNVHPDEA